MFNIAKMLMSFSWPHVSFLYLVQHYLGAWKMAKKSRESSDWADTFAFRWISGTLLEDNNPLPHLRLHLCCSCGWSSLGICFSSMNTFSAVAGNKPVEIKSAISEYLRRRKPADRIWLPVGLEPWAPKLVFHTLRKKQEEALPNMLILKKKTRNMVRSRYSGFLHSEHTVTWQIKK